MASSLQRIAEQLARSRSTLDRATMSAYLERLLLDTNADILRIGQRYGVTSVKEFERSARAGVIRETDTSLDDFFALDRLTAVRAQIRELLRMV